MIALSWLAVCVYVKEKNSLFLFTFNEDYAFDDNIRLRENESGGNKYVDLSVCKNYKKEGKTFSSELIMWSIKKVLLE